MPTTTLQSERRDLRYRGRQALWRESTLPRIRRCGRVRTSSESGVGIAVADGVAHFNNVQSCGSVHACPVCAPKIRQHRAEEIERALTSHLEAGGDAVFVTLTLRHYRGERLADLVDFVANGWRRVWQGRAALRARRRFGVAGVIRSLEITHGVNGWHPHLHVLVFLEGPADLEALEDWLYGRWSRAVERGGVQAPSRAHGVDVRRVTRATLSETLGQYMQKGDLAEELVNRAGGRRVGLELVRHDLKAGRRGEAVTPWGLLASVHEDGDARALELWQEYEQATHGRQSLTWSAGLKARFAIADLEDQALAELEQGGETVCVLDADTWRRVCKQLGLPARLLRAAELGGAAGVQRALDWPPIPL